MDPSDELNDRIRERKRETPDWHEEEQICATGVHNSWSLWLITYIFSNLTQFKDFGDEEWERKQCLQNRQPIKKFLSGEDRLARTCKSRRGLHTHTNTRWRDDLCGQMKSKAGNLKGDTMNHKKELSLSSQSSPAIRTLMRISKETGIKA